MQNIDIVGYINATKVKQSDLAEKLGVSQTAISMVKNGKLEIPKSWVDIIDQEYQVNINDFITNNDNINNMASEPKSEYITGHGSGDKMIDSIFEIIQSNQKLIDNNSKLIEINAELSHFLITKIKNSEKELNHAS